MPWYHYDHALTGTDMAVKYAFGNRTQWIPRRCIKKVGEGLSDDDGVILVYYEWAKTYIPHLDEFKTKAPKGGGWKA